MAIEDGTPQRIDLPAPGVDGDQRAITLPASATTQECAAVAAAIGAHLTDCSGDSTGDTPAETDRWKLAGRPGITDPSRLPRRVHRGEEWRAAGRTW